MGIVFAEMSAWTALTGYTVMKSAFKTKNMKCKCFRIFIMKITYLTSDRRKCIFKELQYIINNKELIKLGFSATVVLVCIFL